MNAFTVVVICLAVASASAGHIGLRYAVLGYPEAHIPSGSVAVGHDGAVIAGPSGSIKTNNGVYGQASAQISGPSGDIVTHGGHAYVAGPGQEHLKHVVAASVVAAPVAHHAVVAGPTSYTTIVGPSAHATIIAPSVHSATWGHQGAIITAPVWKHHGIVAHGLIAHGYHGW